jgi:hypothetical protein
VLGPLGQKPRVLAECLFVDPIADIAVLSAPDAQEFYEEREAWSALVDGVDALQIGDMSEQPTVWLLHLDGTWQKAQAKHTRGIWLTDAAGTCEDGMSGSPILRDDGDESAVGRMHDFGEGARPAAPVTLALRDSEATDMRTRDPNDLGSAALVD